MNPKLFARALSEIRKQTESASTAKTTKQVVGEQVVTNRQKIPSDRT